MGMDKYEAYAVGHFLSQWPECLTFAELMQVMRNDNEDEHQEIWAWELIEAVPLEDLAGLIEDMVSSLRATFN